MKHSKVMFNLHPYKLAHKYGNKYACNNDEVHIKCFIQPFFFKQQ